MPEIVRSPGAMARPAKLAFFGTPDVAVPPLRALLDADDLDVLAVVTNPDRPKGRSGTPVPPPVKVAALGAGIRVLQPARPADVLADLRSLDLDAVAIVAYGAILPSVVLAAGGRGFVNLHFSLLPRWRGAAPVQAAIRAGDKETGVTCFVLDEGMDTGPVLQTATTRIGPGETAGQLLERLTELGSPTLVQAIRGLLAGQEPTPQPIDGATLAPKVRPADVAIDFARSAVEVDRLVRSANPAPGAHTTFRSTRLKVWEAPPQFGAASATPRVDMGPGDVVGRGERGGLLVACGDGAVELTRVQPEGKAAMDGASFANGHQPEPGERLGS